MSSVRTSTSHALPELDRARDLSTKAPPGLLRTETLDCVRVGAHDFPIQAFTIGSPDRARPVLGLFGGIHGLERIGTHVVLSFLESLFEQLRWDRHLRRLFEEVRLVAIPLANPGGMALNRRSNPGGVDLMRNAPVDAEERPPFLAGGHRLGPWLPWYRGRTGGPMELEARALCEFVRREIFPSEFAISLDCHSGFGLRDRLWHPYAKTSRPFAAHGAARALKGLLDRTLPHHVYQVEAQCYRTHGDLWDYFFDEHRNECSGTFLPWTLEMGSWRWVKKNPWQLFSLQGPFNPVKPHRERRTQRRHQALIDFLLKAALNHREWLTQESTP
ncbi:MAG: DUF2817 domain-containing protein [Oligoflexia bacterium]|nr:DUF2817 domain-containing protein [Oligoflexia bacterium]